MPLLWYVEDLKKANDIKKLNDIISCFINEKSTKTSTRNDAYHYNEGLRYFLSQYNVNH